MTNPTTAIEFLKAREKITERPATTRIRDAELARDQAKAELAIVRRDLAAAAKLRDDALQRLAERAHQRAELKMLAAKAVTVLGRHKEHADCRRLATELAQALEKL